MDVDENVADVNNDVVTEAMIENDINGDGNAVDNVHVKIETGGNNNV